MKKGGLEPPFSLKRRAELAMIAKSACAGPGQAGSNNRRDTRPMMSEQEPHIPIRRRLLLGLAALAVGGTLAAILAYRIVLISASDIAVQSLPID